MKINQTVLLFSAAINVAHGAYIPRDANLPELLITECPEPPSNHLPTCIGSRGATNLGDLIALGMLFTHPPEVAGQLFAEFVVQHGPEFVSQLGSISSEAITGTGDQYTTGFKDLYLNNILGLASAAPVYSCYLSSLFSSALATSSEEIRTATPTFPPDLTPEIQLKLRVLFEKHVEGGKPFNYAGLLIEEPNELISQVSSILKDARTNEKFVTGYSTLYADFFLCYAYGKTTKGGSNIGGFGGFGGIGGFFKREITTNWPNTPTVCGPDCGVRTPVPSAPVAPVPVTAAADI